MAEESSQEPKKPMTDEERLALCQKMDQELDDFINSLERTRYTDGWSEDKWEEEMDKHPFFMKTLPENGDMSALAEGLAKLKYDPEENTALELATNYKEDGNFNFRHKNYRLAILGYTEGIKVRCEDAEMNAFLYNNRAAAQYHLKNYRSALADSERALSFKPDHAKARLRAAKCAFEIANYEKCIEHCNKLLEDNPSDAEATELISKTKKKILIQARDKRKQEKLEQVKRQQKDEVVKAILERGIRIANCDEEDDLDLSKLEPSMPGAHGNMVHLENGKLQWPVLLFYPEHLLTDFIVDCPEDVPLETQLAKVFPAPWDTQNQYGTDKVNVYSEGYNKLPHIIDISMDLGDILKMKYFEVKGGTPSFVVVPRGSQVEKKFLSGYFS
ncbi:DNA polymerase interacting tetratricopeptide repeat-containing, protein of 47 kDa [Cydia fagiglandana]|uniref:DNA polymerase interacting tetratricopeptide repeat-containing, protein of 47 kDa n=1 Tax=Cydia fagiglandana TaxID=1458189 RepID=UPI002FEE3D87